MSQFDAHPVATVTQPGFWREVRDVFKGAHRDYTTGSITRAIVLLAIPMVLEMLMQSIFELVDAYFVGRIGADALAAVGVTGTLLILVMAIGIGLSMATTAMVARRIGEKDPEGAGLAAFQGLAISAAISIPISLLGIFLAPEMLGLMATPESAIEVGSGYAAVLFGTNVVILLLFLINAIFRGAGDAVLAMKVLALANLFNIVLDPLLIFGIGPFPELGVTGAAVATTIGRGIGVSYQCYLLTRGKSRIHLRIEQVRLALDVTRRLLRVAGPGVLQFLIGTASWLILFRLINTFGEAAAAGYTVAIRILVFALLPSWGMGNAAATLVGQNLGARQPERAERSVWITSFINAAFLGSVAVGMYLFAEPLIAFFTDDPAVIAIGKQCLRIISYTYVLFAFGAVTMQAFNGAGDTTTPTWINFFSYWFLQIPLAYALALGAGWDAAGVFAAVAISQGLLAIISVLVFRRGYWKAKAI
jgi:putative MATE family efflux protein